MNARWQPMYNLPAMNTTQEHPRANWMLVAAAYLTTAAVALFVIIYALRRGLTTELYALLGVYGIFTALETYLMLGHPTLWARRVLFAAQAVVAAIPFFVLPDSDGFAPILLVLLVAQAFFSFEGREQIGWGALFLGEIFVLLLLITPPLNALSTGALYLGISVFMWAVGRALEREQTARAESERLLRELEGANVQLREYAVRVENLAVAEERTRLAREIHDSLGHHLTVLSVQLQAASKLIERDPKRAAEEIEKSRGVVAQALQDVRQSVSALRETSNVERHPADALPRLVRDFGEATGILAEYHAEHFDSAEKLSPAQALTLYRAVQEGLTNAQKHAHASRVDVRVEQNDSTVRVNVTDNGTGDGAENASPSSFGLIGLRERVELLGGTLTAAPRATGGFELSIVLPLRETGEV